LTVFSKGNKRTIVGDGVSKNQPPSRFKTIVNVKPLYPEEVATDMNNLTGGLTRRSNVWGMLFILPSLIFFIIFYFYPMFNTFQVSLTNYDLLSPPKFIGTGNFQSLLADALFHQSTKATMIYVFVSTIITLILSLGLAMMLNKQFLLKGLFRTVFFMPTVISLVVVGIIWKMLFQPTGLIYELTRHFYPEPMPWLTNGNNALIAIIVARMWRTAGYYMIFFLAGLQGIDQSYYEAAEVDGANRIEQFWYITWHLLKPTTLMVLVISLINALRDFAIPYVMTGGGPSGATRILPILIYETAFDYMKMGKAAAVSVIMFIFVMTFTLIQLRLFRTDT
jgi:ABC-type sugar transport system permease subunit